MTKESIAAIAANAEKLAAKGIMPDTVSMNSKTMAKHSIHATHVEVREGEGESSVAKYELAVCVDDALAEDRFLVSGTQTTKAVHAEG